MLKTKSKILLVLFLIAMFASSCCFATIEPRTTSDTTASEGEPVVTSENGGEPVVTSENEGEPVVTSENEGTESTTTEDITADWTNGDLFVSENKVTISNVVDGNAFVVGKEVTVTGEIGGDLFVIADKLNIDGGYVYSSVFACANEITINGVVYDVYATCSTFNLTDNGFIYRDMKVNASTVNMNGKLRRNANINANTINIKDNGSDPIIYGNLAYSSKSEISIPEGAIEGKVTYSSSNTIVSYIVDLFKTLLLTLVVTLVLLWLTPKFIERVQSMNVTKSFIALGIGVLAPIVLAIVGLLLILSSIGISISVCGIFTFVVLAYIGFAITSIFFSKFFTKLLKMEGNIKIVILTLAVSAILWIICQIPVIGGFCSFVISIFGIGTTLVNIISKKHTKNKIRA